MDTAEPGNSSSIATNTLSGIVDNKMRLIFSLSIIIFKLTVSISASYNVYNYDTGVIFTPDGQLKQVEYASSASTNCQTPTVIIPLVLSSESAVIMATRSSSKKSRGQSRILQMPISQSPSSIECARPFMLVGINGILPDCVSLLQEARGEIHEIQSSYGGYGATSSQASTSSFSSCQFARRVATAVADKCQQNSFGGGIRPFGAEIVLCGMDSRQIMLYITQPSGAIMEYTAHSTKEYVVGGDSRQREDLLRFLANERKRLEKVESLAQGAMQDDAILRSRIKVAAEALIKNYKKEDRGENGELQSFSEEIDLVIGHSRKGFFRLDEDAINALVDQK